MKLDVEKLVDDVSASLISFEKTEEELNCEKLRHLINTFCPAVLVDLDSNEVDVEIAIPRDLLYLNSGGWQLMCNPCGRQYATTGIAHHDYWLKISNFKLLPVIQPTRRRIVRPLIISYTIRPADSAGRPDDPSGRTDKAA